MKLYNNLDINKKQVLNMILHKATSNPSSPADGQVYYNTTDQSVRYYNANTSSWVTLGAGSIVGIVAGEGLGSSTLGGVTTIDINVDGATLEISSDTIRIKDSGVTSAKIADANVTSAKLASNSVVTAKIADANITFSKIQDIASMTVIGRTSAGSGVVSAIPILNESNMASNSATSLATQQSIKSYVDAMVGSIGSLIGAFDASVSSTFPGSPTVVKGNYWYVTAAGTVQGIPLNVGDVIISNKNNPSTTIVTDWIFLETNRDQASTTTLGVVILATSTEVNAGTDANKVVTPATLNQRTATETRTGLIEIATDVETQAGTDDARAVTPLKLKNMLNAAVGGYSGTIGDGVTLTYTVTHNLGTKAVSVALYEAATDLEVWTTVSTPTINTVSIAFESAPATNQFRVVIKK